MVCVFKHLYCSAQLSMSNLEKRYRNKIIIIIIKSHFTIGNRRLASKASELTAMLLANQIP